MANRLTNNPTILGHYQKAYRGESPPILIIGRLNDPLKRKKPARIGVQFMGDLFYKDVPTVFIQDILSVIDRARQHTFLLLTKRIEYFWKQRAYFLKGPLPENAFLGISAENQQTADERIPILLQIPAAKRFVSLEPMLEGMDITPYFTERVELNLGSFHYVPGISWVIIGGLSLPGGKIQPPDPQWIDNIVEQCDEAGVPLFIKENAQYHTKREELG